MYVCFVLLLLAHLAYRSWRSHGLEHPAGLFIGAFLVRRVFIRVSTPTIQTRLMDVARDSQSIAAALNHSALNIGNALGAFLGGLAIAGGLGYVAPIWIGLALCVPGVLFALAGALVSRRLADRDRVDPLEGPRRGVTPSADLRQSPLGA